MFWVAYQKGLCNFRWKISAEGSWRILRFQGWHTHTTKEHDMAMQRMMMMMIMAMQICLPGWQLSYHRHWEGEPFLFFAKNFILTAAYLCKHQITSLHQVQKFKMREITEAWLKSRNMSWSNKVFYKNDLLIYLVYDSLCSLLVSLELKQY